MKKAFLIYLLLALFLAGCSSTAVPAQIAATTLPVYEFTSRICEGTPLSVTRLVTEEVSCLHDYSLNVRQVKAAESADLIVISGAGLEEFLDDILADTNTIDASRNITLLTPEVHHHDHDESNHEGHHHDHDESNHEGHHHDHDESNHEGHHHDEDPHIWLSPANAEIMAYNICSGLTEIYPQYTDTFTKNLQSLCAELNVLQQYAEQELSDLSCRDLITFHDGFSYLAQAFDLTILEAIEEESGSEASAKELIHMIEEVKHHQLPAIFTEKSGSVSASGIIARETGAKEFILDMAMTGNSYFDAMYHNINTLKEALQ